MSQQQTQPYKPKNIVLSSELTDDISNYLATKPAGEVFNLLIRLGRELTPQLQAPAKSEQSNEEKKA